MFDLELAIANWRKEMHQAGFRNDEDLHELESHLRDEIENATRSGAGIQDAFDAAVQSIGRPDALNSEFKKAGLTKGNHMMNHNRVYNALLVALAVYNAVIVAFALLMLPIVGSNWNEPMGRYPAWSLPWLFAITCLYTVLTIWTLLARRYRPQLGRRLSVILNWLLIPAIPGGTIIGLYGLWAGRRREKQHA